MTMTDSIVASIAALKTTPTPDLRAKWRELFEGEPPRYNRRFLENRLAYRIQELAYGGLKPATVARLVEVFDGHAVTFVSVTQSFNTTTSMGRLTLNILLSFAQFEREVIGERIRDKFAASRARGMWMGGHPPLGYDVRERKLVVNEAEAATVRMIFERFLRVGSATVLVRELAAEGVTTKRGKPVDKGFLYKLLANRVYVGEAVHKGTAYPGEHVGIIGRGLWDKVHSMLIRLTPRPTRPGTGLLLERFIGNP